MIKEFDAENYPVISKIANELFDAWENNLYAVYMNFLKEKDLMIGPHACWSALIKLNAAFLANMAFTSKDDIEEIANVFYFEIDRMTKIIKENIEKAH